MPELVEVTITSQQLHRECEGWYLSAITVHKNVKKMSACSYTLPLYISSVWNKGKNIIFNLNDSNGNRFNILSHMMLAGRWSVRECDKPTYDENGNVINLTRITLTLTRDNHTKYIHYCESQLLGEFHLLTQQEAEEKVSKVMPSIRDGLTCEQFCEGVRGRSKMIYPLIMDQKDVLSGVGNYIANEALYRAGIHPKTKANEIPYEQIMRLYNEIWNVCKESYAVGGVSVEDWFDIHGVKGTYWDHCRVFRKQWTPDGRQVQVTKFGKRKTFHI